MEDTVSHPSFLSILTTDAAFVEAALELLDAEYRFWMVDGEHAVTLTDEDGKTHVLNRFWTRTTYPRPESYKEDLSSSVDAVCWGLDVIPVIGMDV